MSKFNRSNKIFSLSQNELKLLILESSSRKEILLKLGYTPNGNQYKNLNQKCKEEFLSFSNLKKRKHSNLPSIKPIEYYLREDFYVSSNFLKRKLFSLNLLEPKC